MIDPWVMLRSMGVATLIGALIGLEREYQHRLKGEKGFAGLRTFMFFALLGNLATWLAELLDPLILPVTFLGIILLVSVTYFRGSGGETDRGMTTEVAALLTFLIGSLAGAGELEVAVALGVIVAVLLSAKPAFHRWVERLTTEDIYTTLKFAVVTFVVLPILPHRAYGPLQAFDPYEIWMVVVLISGISFLGYVALKLLGPNRGTGVSGLLGGLASSTAVAVSFSRRSKENPELSRSCAMAIVVASTVMVARIAVLVAVVNPSMFRVLWIPLAALGVSGTAVSTWLWKTSRHDVQKSEGMEIRNPFRLGAAIAFGAAYAVVLFLVKGAREFLPEGSTGIVAVVSGITQVDAVTLSVAKLARTSMSPNLAAAGIVLAALSNTATKALIGVVMGDRSLRRPLLVSLGIVFLCGLASLPLLYLL